MHCYLHIGDLALITSRSLKLKKSCDITTRTTRTILRVGALQWPVKRPVLSGNTLVHFPFNVAYVLKPPSRKSWDSSVFTVRIIIFCLSASTLRHAMLPTALAFTHGNLHVENMRTHPVLFSSGLVKVMHYRQIGTSCAIECWPRHLWGSPKIRDVW